MTQQDDFPATTPQPAAAGRLAGLSVGDSRTGTISARYSRFVKSLRLILPLAAIVMTVIVITWDEGKNVAPMKKEELIPASQNVQNELLKPVFNSVDDKQQPFNVSADRAVQDRQNPDLVALEKPVADLSMNDGTRLDADANQGLYEQKTQKLNLSGSVHLKHSNGYTLGTEELRVDLAAQKAFSGRDVHIEGPDGTLDATGLEGDAGTGVLVFTGPAKIILNNQGDFLKSVQPPAPEQHQEEPSKEETHQGNTP